jgi:uncharacterized protein (DUF58 family)
VKTRPRVRIRPTFYGWVIIFLLFWLPMAAIGSANNFLLIVSIMLGGLVVLSHRLGRRNIRSVRITRTFPEEVFAERPFPVTYRVRSDVRPWGAATIGVSEQEPLIGSEDHVEIPSVQPGESLTSVGYFSAATRGEKTIAAPVASSSFPFGLAVYSRTCGDEASLVVFPKIDPVDREIPFRVGEASRGIERATPAGTIPYHFREYAPGDPVKAIDWKKSAQTGAVITRTFSEEGAREIVIRLPSGAGEAAVSRAASLVVHFGRLGTPLALHGPGLHEGPGRGSRFTRRLLTILAKWDQTTPGTDTGSAYAVGITAEIGPSGKVVWKSRSGLRVHGHDHEERMDSGHAAT